MVFHNSDGSKSNIEVFGVRRDKDFGQLREQVRIFYSFKSEKPQRESMYSPVDEFALDMSRDTQPNQIIIVKIPLLIRSRASGAKPFFVMWVDNAELLQPGIRRNNGAQPVDFGE